MIADNIKTLMTDALSGAGFTPVAEYSSERLRGVSFPALYRLKRIALSDHVNGAAHRCRADATFSIRACGNDKSFADESELCGLCSDFMSRLFFSSDVSVKTIECAPVVRNMALQRLEYPIEVVFSMSFEEEE